LEIAQSTVRRRPPPNRLLEALPRREARRMLDQSEAVDLNRGGDGNAVLHLFCLAEAKDPRYPKASASVSCPQGSIEPWGSPLAERDPRPAANSAGVKVS
jgi:hypothetical protein